MKIILLQTVKGIGEKGKVTEVSTGYARNYLLPYGLAKEADPQSLKNLEEKRKRETKEQQKKEEELKKIAEQLPRIILRLKTKVGDQGRLYGSITSQDIVDTLAKQENIKIDKKRVKIPSPIKSVGEHYINLKLLPGLNVQLKVLVESEE